MSGHYAETQLIEHQQIHATGDVDLQATSGILEVTVYRTSGEPVVICLDAATVAAVIGGTA